jgi:sensor domain CHASE-containing protein
MILLLIGLIIFALLLMVIFAIGIFIDLDPDTACVGAIILSFVISIITVIYLSVNPTFKNKISIKLKTSKEVVHDTIYIPTKSIVSDDSSWTREFKEWK